MPITNVARDEIYASDALKRAQGARRIASAARAATIQRVNTGAGAPSATSRYSGADRYVQDVRNYTAAIRGGGGGGGAVAAGGGGGGGGAPAPAAAARTPTPEELSKFNIDEITAALNALSSVFGLKRGELETDQEAAGRFFNILRRGLLENQDLLEESTTDEAAGKGILRSGLYLNRIGEIGEQTAEQLAQARKDRDARLAAISRSLGGLKSQEEAERAVTARNLAKEQLATKEQLSQALQLV